ncbi:hypothetical protein V1514DRAFT_284043 [Lipomyces japonicus]|uniref:uncharacterized protein n=1 Tax=Lipomyces japonicus TaxID=56871 RepID=UPI0034CD04DB
MDIKLTFQSKEARGLKKQKYFCRTESRKRLDPAAIFPAEIFHAILDHVPFPFTRTLLVVSSTWNYLLNNYFDYSRGYKSLDFSHLAHGYYLTHDFLLYCLRKAGPGNVQSILATPRSPLKFIRTSVLIAILLLQVKPGPNVERDLVSFKGLQEQGVWSDDENDSHSGVDILHESKDFMQNISIVGLPDEGATFIFQQWNHFVDNPIKQFSTLQNLTLSLEVVPALVTFLVRSPTIVRFPNLEILNCPMCSDGLNLIVWPDMSSLSFSLDFNAFPALHIWRLGGNDNKNYRIFRINVDQQCLDVCLRWMPNLKIFHGDRIHIGARGSYGYMIERSNFSRKANLEQMTLVNSIMDKMPTLSRSCRRLDIRGSGLTPRSVYYDVEGNITGYVSDPRMVEPEPGMERLWADIEAHNLKGVLKDEYSGIEYLDVSGMKTHMTNARLVDILVRCGGVAELIVQHCPKLKFAHLELGEAIVPASCLAEQITMACPRLRKLKVTGCHTFTDTCLQALRDLNLEYLDVSDTSVTAEGVLQYLRDHEQQLKTFICPFNDEIVQILYESNVSVLKEQEVPVFEQN